MDIEHPDIGRYQRHGYLPEDEHYVDDLFEDRLDRYEDDSEEEY